MRNKLVLDQINYSTELATLYLIDYTLKQLDTKIIHMNIYLDMESQEQHYLCF